MKVNDKVSSSYSIGTFLVAQRLALHDSTAGDTSLIPGWGTKIPLATQHDQKIVICHSLSREHSSRVLTLLNGVI